ncbi:hypothetical protein LCGC14_2332160 [marine sediment metagenome]|uniref:Uncharacterized protein n=1 Tax=marine sediment metagenome TaxID=412755 RepID=A0A0F9ESA5_9ZZZZ
MKDLVDLNEEIDEQIEDGQLVGAYSHNIIALVLQQVDREHGRDMANKMIDAWNLEALGWRKLS